MSKGDLSHFNFKDSFKRTDVFMLSVCGSGFFPKAPGTFASLLTAILFYFIGLSFPLFFLVPIMIFLTLGSCFLAEKIRVKYGLKDPSWIVIDEFLGVFITFLFISKMSFLSALLALALFRFFDIVKPWPVSYFDKDVEHGAGVILDDIAAGFLAGFIVWPVTHFVKFLS